jgi:hypothetical protein
VTSLNVGSTFPGLQRDSFFPRARGSEEAFGFPKSRWPFFFQKISADSRHRRSRTVLRPFPALWVRHQCQRILIHHSELESVGAFRVYGLYSHLGTSEAPAPLSTPDSTSADATPGNLVEFNGRRGLWWSLEHCLCGASPVLLRSGIRVAPVSSDCAAVRMPFPAPVVFRVSGFESAPVLIASAGSAAVWSQ